MVGEELEGHDRAVLGEGGEELGARSNREVGEGEEGEEGFVGAEEEGEFVGNAGGGYYVGELLEDERSQSSARNGVDGGVGGRAVPGEFLLGGKVLQLLEIGLSEATATVGDGGIVVIFEKRFFV